MTFRDRAKQELEAHGLDEHQAQEVIAQYLESNTGAAMRSRADDNMEGYGPDGTGDILFVGMWMGLKLSAIHWIDSNLPKHWARGMFV